MSNPKRNWKQRFARTFSRAAAARGDQSSEAPAAGVAGAPGGGASEVGTAGLFCAVCFLAAAGGGAGLASAGGGAAGFALAAGAPARCPGAAVPVPGSGVMMLTGGVEDALGNSALVGRPLGNVDGSIATGPGVGGGAFHDAA
jgi:hypothetical protein